MNKFYTVEKVINGKKYVAQFNGIGAALDAVDSTQIVIDGIPTTSSKKMAKYLLENVIVEPKNLTPDDFEDMEEFNEVTGFAREVMQGNFREENNRTAKKASGK